MVNSDLTGSFPFLKKTEGIVVARTLFLSKKTYLKRFEYF